MRKLTLLVLLCSLIAVCAARDHRGDHDDGDGKGGDMDECEMIDCDKDSEDSDDDDKRGGHDLDDKDLEDMTEQERHVYEEYKRECKRREETYEHCCEGSMKGWMKILLVGGTLFLVIAGVVLGCCCYHKRCKPRRTKTRPERLGQSVISVPSTYASAPQEKKLPSWEVVDFSSKPPAYSTLPVVNTRDPRELILSPPPPYSTDYKY